jgi:hypothetical protein
MKAAVAAHPVRTHKAFITWAAALLCAAVLLTGGCGKAERPAGFDEKYSEKSEAPYPEEFEVSPDDPAAAEGGRSGVSDTGQPADSAAAPPEQVPEEQERKRVYQGYARLLVGRPEQTRDQLMLMAEESGGYVESVAGYSVVLRVPASLFRSVYDQILTLGEIMDSSVETFDVTDQITDFQGRLDIATRTRARLYALLDRTADTEERVKILREIRRLTDYIEQITQNLELLESQVAFSRITVELEARHQGMQDSSRVIPFPWIDALDPLYASISDLKGKVMFSPGEDFAVFDREESYRAESPDGTRIRIGSLPNNPAGDELFWQRALAYHLKARYGKAEEKTAGRVRGVLFTSKGPDPFYYFVGVLADGRTLYVAEVLFPDSESLDLHLDGLMTALDALRTRGWLP